MAHRTPTPLRALGALLRAVLGLAVLAALTGGIPYLLLTTGHQPTELASDVNLLEQDDGSLFLVVLTCIGWVAWAAFTVSVLLEIVALLRRRSAPKIKGLSGLQSLASFLIGGIVLLAPTAASAATTTPAIAATAVHTVGANGTGTTAAATPSARAADSAWPTHRVASPTELPWDLAEEYLHDGTRWKDIAALNPGIPQLVAGDQYLPQGAVITLPADAQRATPATSATTSRSTTNQPTTPPAQAASDQHHNTATHARGTHPDGVERPESVTVREGDSLWSIADAHGDPENWPALYEANKGERTPDGGTFDNPDLIFPGQVLKLPPSDTAVTPPAHPDTGNRAPQDQPERHHDHKPAPGQTPDRAAEKPARPSAPPAPSRTAQPAPSSTSPTPGQDRSSTPPPAVHPNDDPTGGATGGALAPAAVWAGAGALAAALVATLATRRILQQRRRRPGRRIPMPAGRAAATEQGLRAAQHPTGFDLLGTALRSLALNLTAAARDLPIIEAVVLHEAKVELHLAQDTVPMQPFSAAAGRQDLWICPASSPHLANEQQLKGADTPYPALVSIGWDGAGHLVLVDLEHIGILNLDGEGDFARHVLQAIAVELASTPLPGHLEITALADTTPGLDTAAPERVVRIDDLAAATAELTSHTADQRRALAAVGADSLRAARLMDTAADAWTPHILLAASLPEGTERTALFDTLVTEPRAAGAVITAAGAPGELPATAWTLDCQGPDHTIALPGSRLPVKLQGLSDAHFADAVELLTLAASDADVPAPAWTRTEEDPLNDDYGQGEPDNADPSPSEASATGAGPEAPASQATAGERADDDGLPSEYAELELEAAAEDAGAPGIEKAEDADDGADTAPATGRHRSRDEGGRQAEPAAGPSLADVLAAAEHDDAAVSDPAASRTQVGERMPTAGPTDAALASPCAVPALPTVHVTLPAPAPSSGTDRSADSAPRTASGIVAPAAPEPTAEAADSTSPKVLLLGPISIDGASGRIDSSRRSAGIELVTFLALNPGVDHHAIDDGLWPGRLVGKEMRNAVISRTRSWLGKDADGNAHLPRVQDTGDSRYRLGPAVTCDWTRFQRFARTGLGRANEDGDLALRRALALVRGRPFTGIDPQRYAWAEPFIQEMVSAVVDVAYELASRRREAGDIPGALWAAHRGLLAAEESELLHRQIFLAHHAAGDIDALREAAARLVRVNEQLGGVDMEAETADLLRTLLPRPVTRSR
ncbi:LysM peptidoglycan-binding domain-containing protein [Streptomyces melanogenes]|uniref:LysM peptidoglycan-binding domain-containing protein n=1 Tax=Streptomyces melanogenes TaxID=67326 RepID=UPI0037BE1C92